MRAAVLFAAAAAAQPQCPKNASEPEKTKFCIFPVYGGGTCINPNTQDCCSAGRPDGMSGTVCPTGTCCGGSCVDRAVGTCCHSAFSGGSYYTCPTPQAETTCCGGKCFATSSGESCCGSDSGSDPHLPVPCSKGQTCEHATDKWNRTVWSCGNATM